METTNVKTNETAITPLQAPDETITPAEDSSTATRQAAAPTEAFRVNISEEARAEEETEDEEALEAAAQGVTEQTYTNTGEIA